MRLRRVKLLQTKRRKTIRWYLMEGGGIQHFQIKLKFWHYTTNKFDLQAHKQKHMKLSIDIVIKQIYLFNIVAWNYRKKIGFPVCKKENFAGIQAHRKRGKSARASPTPHHTLNEERSARFTAQPSSALLLFKEVTRYNSCEIWHSFSRALMRNFLWCYYRWLITSLALQKCKKECNIRYFKLFWYKVFVHGELKVLSFLVDSVAIV